MTIRDLMTHTAGLSYGWFADTPVDHLYRESKVSPYATSLKDFVAFLASMPLVFQPGSHWRYSHATDVLGHLVEVVADEALDSFMKQRIFEPLGMVDTGFGIPQAKADRLTSVYCPSESYSFTLDYSTLEPGVPIYPIDTPAKSLFIEPKFLSGIAGGGGLVSSLPDYFRFTQMLANKGVLDGVELLGRKTVELMTMNHVPKAIRPLEIGGNPMPGTGFGLGVSVLEDPAAAATLESGGSYGWGGAAMTNFWIDPVEEITGIFMTQFMPSDFYRVVREFRVLAYQALRN
jgi:CubicO group peptidase (beta-lactamase class C family)